MAFDFKAGLTPEQRARVELRERNLRADIAECRALTNEQLIERTTYYLSQCGFKHQYAPGEPVYDGVIAHVIIPELLRRLKP